jgi:hypothetical protein
MRDYSKVGPQFWIGETGKRLRGAGMEAQIVAMYLMTCPHANMIGLFYVSMVSIAHETGLGMEGATKGLARAIEAGFCCFDEASEVVWVQEMAAYQIAAELDAKDNRCKGVQNEYDSLPANPWLAPFYERYGTPFHMSRARGPGSPPPLEKKGPTKPLRSQEQEQEQKQEQKKTAPPALPAWLPISAWNSWLEVRKKKRAAPTDKALELTLRDLDRWRTQGHDIEEIINHSIKHNYTGLFEPKHPPRKPAQEKSHESRPAVEAA